MESTSLEGSSCSLKRKYASRKCCVDTCTNTNLSHHMYTFPRVKEGNTFARCLTWVKNCGNRTLLKRRLSDLYSQYYLCCDHFNDDSYVCPAKKQRLKMSAVPTIACGAAIPADDLFSYVSEHATQYLNFAGPHKIENVPDHINKINHLGVDGSVEKVEDVIVAANEGIVELNDVHDIPSISAGSGNSEEAISNSLVLNNSLSSTSTGSIIKVVEQTLDRQAEAALLEDVRHDHLYSASSDNILHHPHEIGNKSSDLVLNDSCSNEDVIISATDGPFCNMERNDSVDQAEIISVECNDTLNEVEVYAEDVPNVIEGPLKRIKRKCCVLGCEENNTTKSMFAFPTIQRFVDGRKEIDESLLLRCRSWVKFSGNVRVLSRNMLQLHKFFYVCSSHFGANDFYGKQLKRNAIPSLLAPEPLGDDVVGCQHLITADKNNFKDDSIDDDSVEGVIEITDRLHDLKSMDSRNVNKKFEEAMRSSALIVCPECNEKYMFYPGMKKVHRHKNLCWKFSARNNMDPGDIPAELEDLTFIEEKLIARVHPILTVFKLKGLQYGYRGNVINFSQDVKEFATKLPHNVDELSCVLTVQFKNNRDEVTDFRVRAWKVREALMWLKRENPYYKEIEISEENLQALPDDSNVFGRLNSLSMDRTGEDSSDDEIEEDEEDPKHGMGKVYSSGVPVVNFATQNEQINNALDWPELTVDPLSESLPGLIVCAFPTLFPKGNCDLKDPREVEIKMHDYFKHLMAYSDDRFANHKTFRFFAFNMWMRNTALSSGNVFVNMDKQLSRMNVGELKQHIEENPKAMNKLMFMGTNLRGSKSFWKSRCGELKDMVEQIGLPTIFLTMSAADYYWPDLFRLLSGKDISEIPMKERRQLIQDNSLVVDTFFQCRLECYIETVLKPKYEVTDMWYRIEYQHRGSPHVHGLFWLKNAPDMSKYSEKSDEEKVDVINYFDKLVCAVDPDSNSPLPEKHPCEIFLQDVVDFKLDLSQLLKTVQKHNHSKGYCERIDSKTKKPYCRFKFPAEVREKASIEVQPESGEIEFLPERNDDKLNKFNVFIISSWRANIDIAPVLSKRAVIEYLTKYVSKSEVKSTSLKEICENVCSSLTPDDKAKRAVHKLLMKNCVERDVSAQEVCHILMGSKLYSSGGRDFVVVYTNDSKWVPLTSENEDQVSSYTPLSRGKSFMQKYAERPSHLHHVSMFDIAKLYNLKSWREVNVPNIVRVFPRLKLDADESMNEDYYRQQVLLFVPWNKASEDGLKRSEELWKDVYDQHGVALMKTSELNINVTANNEDLSDDEDENHGDVSNEDWMIASRLSAARQCEKVELGRREIDVQYDWDARSKVYEDYGDLKFFKGFIEMEKKKSASSFHHNELPNVVFSAEQEAVKNLMEEQIEALLTGERKSLPKRVLVQGKAGTGKSLLIRYLVSNLYQKFGDGSFLLMGPTGVCAVNINGATIHSVLKIPRKRNKFQPLKGEIARCFCDMMAKVKFVIIDEYSMIGCNLMGMIDKRFREGTGVNEPFGSLNVYLFGDIRQLPPVKDFPVFTNLPRGDLGPHGKVVIDSFEKYFVLSTAHRQRDVKFLQVLDRLSVADVTTDDYNIMKQRFTTNVSRSVLNDFDDAVRLFSTKDAVKKYNEEKLHNLKDENGNLVPVARVPAKHNGKGASNGTTDQAQGLHGCLHLARGTKIMLRVNLWVQKGLVNGSSGSVVDMLYNENQRPLIDAPSIIMCKFDNYVGPGVGPDNLVPVTQVVNSWTSFGGVHCSRQQFPIDVCYACSIHKSQGLTLEKAVIDVGPREFALGLMYVGLSRVKSLEGLLLMPFSFQRMSDVKLRPELRIREQFVKSVFG